LPSLVTPVLVPCRFLPAPTSGHATFYLETNESDFHRSNHTTLARSPKLPPPMNDGQAADIAKALSHPLRFELLRNLRERKDLSPVEYARDSGESLGNVSYHFSVLVKAKVIAQTGSVARRGAMEHRYSLSGRRAKVTLAVLDLLGEA
jgi:DNA-binding transcriptional ArsR family regulator